MKPQTVQIVRQGEATPYWFKFNPLYNGVSTIFSNQPPLGGCVLKHDSHSV